MNCPDCGAPATIYGLPNQNYPGWFRCSESMSRHGRYDFYFCPDDLPVEQRAAADREFSASAATSRANADAMRGGASRPGGDER